MIPKRYSPPSAGSAGNAFDSTNFRTDLLRLMWKKKKFFLCVTVLALYLFYKNGTSNITDIFTGSKEPSLKIEDDTYFTIRTKTGEEKKLQILSGAIHYFRVVPEYWEDRMIKLKAAGLNTLETYVPWNLHEETHKNFSFTNNLDIVKYLELASKHELYVIFRPGPYICAEWDFGGLPSWLLSDPAMKVRVQYDGYLNAVKEYFSVLIPLILPYQYNKNGPIIMVQVENEYGSYAQSKNHVTYLARYLKTLGVTEMLFTSDGFQDGKIELGSAGPDVYAAVNDRDHIPEALTYLRKYQQHKPLMVGEYWTGWFDHWGRNHQTYPLIRLKNTITDILERNASVSMYMFHGGTSFGFMNGANIFNGMLQHQVSSYDYDCPVSESGLLTPKFYAIQQLLRDHPCMGCIPPFTDEKTKAIVEGGPGAVAYGELDAKEYITLIDAFKLIIPWTIKELVPMEMVCNFLESKSINCQPQNFGFIAYRTQVPSATQNIYFDLEVVDRALIILDGVTKNVLEPMKMGDRSKVHLSLSEGNPKDLIILVENMGRVNYNKHPDVSLNYQRKGILNGQVFAGKKSIESWQVYNLDLSEKFMKSLVEMDNAWTRIENEILTQTQPIFVKFNLKKEKLIQSKNYKGHVADTFLKPEGFTKGQAFVNSFNLGRYWSKGPTQTMYIPGPRLEETLNDKEALFILFELHKSAPRVNLVDKAILG